MKFGKKHWNNLIVCIAVTGEKFQSRAMTLTLVRQCPISNLSEIFSYTTMYLNFMFIDRLLFELSCKNTETQKHRNTENGNTHTDSDEYSIVGFCKNATIKIMYAIYISNYFSFGP